MRVRTVFVTTLAPACSVLLITGCDEQERIRQAESPPVVEIQRTAGEQPGDETLVYRVKNALNDSAEYKFPGVEVAVKDAVVRLSGVVETEEQKTRAENIAKAEARNVPVENRITVKQ